MKTRQILAAMLLASMVALTACGQQPADTQTTAEQVQQADEGETVDLGGLIDDSVPLAGAPAMSTVLTPVASGSDVKKTGSAGRRYVQQEGRLCHDQVRQYRQKAQGARDRPKRHGLHL